MLVVHCFFFWCKIIKSPSHAEILEAVSSKAEKSRFFYTGFYRADSLEVLSSAVNTGYRSMGQALLASFYFNNCL